MPTQERGGHGDQANESVILRHGSTLSTPTGPTSVSVTVWPLRKTHNVPPTARSPFPWGAPSESEQAGRQCGVGEFGGRRCGSRTSQSTVMCACHRGKCLTPVCSTVCAASVRYGDRWASGPPMAAARSGTPSQPASVRSRPTLGKWPGIDAAMRGLAPSG